MTDWIFRNREMGIYFRTSSSRSLIIIIYEYPRSIYSTLIITQFTSHHPKQQSIAIMFSKSLLLSSAIFSITITAQELLGNRSLEERATRSLGGYALLTTLCPNDMDQCGGQTYCCPTTLTCIGEDYIDNICCPGCTSPLPNIKAHTC
jgi:hypothetical protein